jgi:hypothetical protein
MYRRKNVEPKSMGQSLKRRIDSIEPLRNELAVWENDRNKVPKAIDGQFSTDDARIKLKRLYPNI